MNCTITNSIAEALYTGIVRDTGFFRYPNTSDDALHIAAKLIDAGARPAVVAKNLENRPFLEWKELAEVLASVLLLSDGRIGVAFLDKKNGGNIDTDWIMEHMSMFDSIELAVLLQREKDNINRLRIRTNQINARKVASFFGGGGRSTAAGATLYGEFYSVKKILIHKLEEFAKGDFYV